MLLDIQYIPHCIRSFFQCCCSHMGVGIRCEASGEVDAVVEVVFLNAGCITKELSHYTWDSSLFVSLFSLP